MALKSTVFKAELQLADLDRGHFGDYSLTLARHPSETDLRMMVRLLAFALHAGEDLRFGKGLSTDDEPALWEIDPAGVIRCWIEVGQPDEDRVRKAASRAERVVVLAYGDKAVDVWWQQNRDKFARFGKLTVLRIGSDEGEALAALAERSMKLSCTVQEGRVYLEPWCGIVPVPWSMVSCSSPSTGLMTPHAAGKRAYRNPWNSEPRVRSPWICCCACGARACTTVMSCSMPVTAICRGC